jgi:alpha-tubulin suppressor-like RCC1 family protein
MKSLRVYYKSINNPDGTGMQSDLDYDLFKGLAMDDNGEAITSFSRLFLRNSGNDCCSSYMRDAYIQRVSSGLNAETMASRPVLVFINGEFWGMYNARERYSPEYVEDHYGVNKDMVTWIENDYSKVHTDHNAPVVLASGVAGGDVDFNNLVSYIKSHNMSNSSYYEYVCSQMDIDSFIDVYAVRLFFNAIDWPENNLKAWKNTNPNDPSGMDTKWHFTLLDTDMGVAFYDDLTRVDQHIYDRAFNYNSVTSNIMMGLLNNSTFKQKFLSRYYELITKVFTPAYLESQLEAMVAERRALMTLQGKRWGNEGSAGLAKFDAQVAKMRDFVRNRHSYALSMLCSYFNTSVDELESANPHVTVSYDSSKVTLTVNGQTVANGTKLEIAKAGQTFSVQATAKTGYRVQAVIFTTASGQMTRIEGSTATFTLTGSGTITASVLSVGSSQTQLAVDAGLTAGGDYLFYLKENGDLYAWGSNAHGVLGLGASPSVATKPALVMKNVAKVATGESGDLEKGNNAWSTAILTRDGCVYTVGSNSVGQLGRNGTVASVILGQINFTGRVVDVSMGHDHLLILDESGTLWGVGSNTYGQLGAANNGSGTTSFQKIATGVKTMVAGRRNTMYLDNNNDLYGLGDNRYYKINRTSATSITTPYKMLSNVAYIDAGEHQMLAITTDGTLYYAGWRDINGFSQGSGNNPVMAKLTTGVVKADIFFGDITILKTDGAAYVYGIGTATGHVATYGTLYKMWSSGVADVAAGYAFTAYLMTDGTIRVDGNNTNGVAGNGHTGGTVKMSQVVFS